MALIKCNECGHEVSDKASENVFKQSVIERLNVQI
jgi:hypothetical protein